MSEHICFRDGDGLFLHFNTDEALDEWHDSIDPYFGSTLWRFPDGLWVLLDWELGSPSSFRFFTDEEAVQWLLCKAREIPDDLQPIADSMNLVKHWRLVNSGQHNPPNQQPRHQEQGGAEDEPERESHDKISTVLTLLILHPGWSDTKIAKEARVSRTTLYRWPWYVKARAALKAGKKELPKGFRDQDGNLEAFD